MLPRVLEPEVMDSEADAREYDSMDHAAVNSVFVADLLEAVRTWTLKRPGRSELKVLDLGAGTAQIPIELCRSESSVRVVAVDAAESMLAVGRANVAAAGRADRIGLVLADAKRLPFSDGSYPIVVSNSIVHHIAEPAEVLTEANWARAQSLQGSTQVLPAPREGLRQTQAGPPTWPSSS